MRVDRKETGGLIDGVCDGVDVAEGGGDSDYI